MTLVLVDVPFKILFLRILLLHVLSSLRRLAVITEIYNINIADLKCTDVEQLL